MRWPLKPPRVAGQPSASRYVMQSRHDPGIDEAADRSHSSRALGNLDQLVRALVAAERLIEAPHRAQRRGAGQPPSTAMTRQPDREFSSRRPRAIRDSPAGRPPPRRVKLRFPLAPVALGDRQTALGFTTRQSLVLHDNRNRRARARAAVTNACTYSVWSLAVPSRPRRHVRQQSVSSPSSSAARRSIWPATPFKPMVTSEPEPKELSADARAVRLDR